jgi:DNA (cytosine-5)-methyltransferase 1
MPWLLDLFSGAGGCAMGYHQAGFDVVGIDNVAQPRYPFEHVVADAMEVLNDVTYLRQFDVIHASPPCQHWSKAGGPHKVAKQYPQLIEPTRRALQRAGVPWIMENVRYAPLIDPIQLCGCMFDGLNVYRPRLFESSMPLPQPEHRPHTEPILKMGRKPIPGHRMYIVGNFAGVKEGRKAMGIPWMTRDELSHAIPPAYTEWIGHQLLRSGRTCHGPGVKGGDVGLDPAGATGREQRCDA